MSLSFLDPGNAPDLVYRKVPHMDSLVFASLEDAMFLDQIHEAIGAETWQEFEYLMPAAELAELIAQHNEDCDYEEAFLIPPRLSGSKSSIYVPLTWMAIFRTGTRNSWTYCCRAIF